MQLVQGDGSILYYQILIRPAGFIAEKSITDLNFPLCSRMEFTSICPTPVNN